MQAATWAGIIAIAFGSPAVAADRPAAEKICRWEVAKLLLAGSPAPVGLAAMEKIFSDDAGCGIGLNCSEIFDRVVDLCLEASGEEAVQPDRAVEELIERVRQRKAATGKNQTPEPAR
jgi:hypothetical protein